MVGPRNGFVKGFREPAAYLEDGGFTGDGPAGGKRPFSAGRHRIPRVGAGDRMFPREPFMRRRRIAKIAPQQASGSPVQPCGLVCEVMACRMVAGNGRGPVGLEVRVLVQAVPTARCARSGRRSRRKLTPVLAGLAFPAGREAVPSPTGRASPRDQPLLPAAFNAFSGASGSWRRGQDVPQGTLYAPAQNRQNRPPTGFRVSGPAVRVGL